MLRWPCGAGAGTVFGARRYLRRRSGVDAERAPHLGCGARSEGLGSTAAQAVRPAVIASRSIVEEVESV